MKRIFASLMTLLSLVLFTTSCSKSSTSTTPPAATAPTASFTFSAANLVVTFTNTSTNATSYSWNFGDGSAASTTASPVYTYAAAGTYTVTLTATGSGGTNTVSESVTVTAGTTSGPGPNLLTGGDFSDTTHWVRYPIYAGVNVTYTNNSAVWSGGDDGGFGVGSGGHYGIWQAVTVTAGKTYAIDMHVASSNLYNVWFEVYVSDTIPDLSTLNNTTDYNYGGRRLALNTWDCGTNGIGSFTGQLSAITCGHDSNQGQTAGYYGTAWNEISFTNAMLGGATGTVYIMIRAGGDSFTEPGAPGVSSTGTGITVTNVTFNSLN